MASNTKVKELVSPVFHRIDALRRERDAPMLVAIDGRSGVGKSFLAGIIQTRTNGTLVCGDDFYAGGRAVHAQMQPAQLADMCIDRARLRCVLQELKSGGDARFYPFDWKVFDGRLADEEKIVKASAVLIVEGVYAFHPEFRDLADLSVLIESPEETRLQRLLSREGELSEWEQQWQRAEAWYFEHLSPPGVFDMQIMND